MIRLQTLVELERERATHSFSLHASMSADIIQARVEEGRERVREQETTREEARLESWMEEVIEGRKELRVLRERDRAREEELEILKRRLADFADTEVEREGMRRERDKEKERDTGEVDGLGLQLLAGFFHVSHDLSLLESRALLLLLLR